MCIFGMTGVPARSAAQRRCLTRFGSSLFSESLFGCMQGSTELEVQFCRSLKLYEQNPLRTQYLKPVPYTLMYLNTLMYLKQGASRIDLPKEGRRAHWSEPFRRGE